MPELPPGVESVLSNLSAGSIEKFRRLTPAGRNYFLTLAEPLLRGKGDMASLEALYSVDYDRIPPDPHTFITHSDYCGGSGKDLFPAWRPLFEEVCDPRNGIYELDATGAMGIGKTTFAMFVVAYKILRTSCLRDPAAFYGLGAKSKIFFGLYAITKRLIHQVGFYTLRDMIIDTSPYFRDVFPRSPFGKELIRWPQKNLEVVIGSNELHAIGKNLIVVVADELNYYEQGVKTEMKARELVSEVSRRLESRFLQHGGDIAGIAIYLSQTRTTADYLEQRIRDKKDVKGVKIVRGPRWRFAVGGYDHKDGFHPQEDPTFRVFVGTEVADPKILDKVLKCPDGTSKVESLNADAKAPEGRIIEVPLVHYRAFEDDIHGALRALADEPSGSFTPFFPRREIVEAAFDETLPFPFEAQVLLCYEKSEQRLQDAFNHRMVTRVNMGKLEPIRHPDAPRYIHLDLSIRGDLTGFAMVHPSAHYREDRKPDALEDPKAQVGEGEIIKEIEADFAIDLKSGPYGEPIDYRKVRIFLDWLRRCGFWIRVITADQFMSFDMLQRLREMGFIAEVQSVDKTSQPYRDLRQAMNEGRVRIPYPANCTPAQWGSVEDALRRVILYQEITGLEHDVRQDKVDHRETNPDGSKGSKDVADALTGATFRCLIDKTQPGENPNVATYRQATNAKLAKYMDKAPF